MTSPILSVLVPGLPAPGGSKKAFIIRTKGGGMRANVVDDGKRNKDWRASVALACQQAMNGREPFDQPLRVRMAFGLPRPKGHSGKRGLRASAPAHPTTKPDVLKLARSTEDAMTGIVWRDDSCTVELELSKHYATNPGCYIEVAPMPVAAGARG